MANEKRLIDADVLERLKYTHIVKFGWGAVVEKILPLSEAPTVDAVEVVHGRCEKSVMKDEWYGHIYTCKECKYQCMVDDGAGNEVAPNYCPNCGAKMDGGESDGS